MDGMGTRDELTAQRAEARVRSFASFFKNYMGLSSIIVAALPIPVTRFDLIPIASADQKGYLSVYTSLFCFLMFAYIFYSRH